MDSTFDLSKAFTTNSYNTMNDAKSYVGRLAQLCNIMSKPELNESYVLIQSFLPDRNRFSVKTIPSPMTDSVAITLAVKLESLRVFPKRYFHDDYPHAVDLHLVNFAEQAHLLSKCNGTVLHLDTLQPSGVSLSLVFLNSHRVLGRKVALDANGIPHPKTTLHGDVYVCSNDEEYVIEFEDIMFVENPSSVTCTREKHITFRRCSFQHAWVTVSTGKDHMIAGNAVLQENGANRVVGAPNVVFENCVFDSLSLPNGSYGVYAGCDGTVTLLNCVIRNCEMGVNVGTGGTCTLIHCAIENCIDGVGFNGRPLGSSMSNCTIANSKQSGVKVAHTGYATITDCKIDGGQMGIHIHGKSKHTCHLSITNCHISNCGDGIGLEMGKIDAQISSTTICNSDRYGLSVLPGVVGKLEVNRCTIMESKNRNVINTSGAECTFTLNGVVQKPILARYEPPTKLHARRCCQLAGICDINCARCGKKEEVGEKFKKCGKCEDVCYCSRECQKAHLKDHKLVCVENICKVVL